MQNNKDQKPANDNEQGWNVDEVADEASLSNVDEIQRQVLRGDESKGDANNRDAAGVVDSKDTPRGREETKNDLKGSENQSADKIEN